MRCSTACRRTDLDDRALQLDVMIVGREYRVACREDERDALMQAVAHLDARMREIRDAGKVTGVDRIAVMAALNIANDLLRERAEPATRKRGLNGQGSGAGIDDVTLNVKVLVPLFSSEAET